MPSVQRARAQSARPWVAAPETASPGLTVFSFATLPLILAAASLREFDSGDIERVLHVNDVHGFRTTSKSWQPSPDQARAIRAS
jgi:hypothetical protein